MRAEHCSQGFHRRPNSRRVYRTTGQMRGSCRLHGLVGTHHDHLRHQIRYDKLLIALREGGTTTTKGKSRRACSARSLNKAVDAWRMMLA